MPAVRLRTSTLQALASSSARVLLHVDAHLRVHPDMRMSPAPALAQRLGVRVGVVNQQQPPNSVHGIRDFAAARGAQVYYVPASLAAGSTSATPRPSSTATALIPRSRSSRTRVHAASRRSLMPPHCVRLQRVWFAGGTVDVVQVSEQLATRASSLEELFKRVAQRPRCAVDEVRLAPIGMRCPHYRRGPLAQPRVQHADGRGLEDAWLAVQRLLDDSL